MTFDEIFIDRHEKSISGQKMRLLRMEQVYPTKKVHVAQHSFRKADK